MRGLIAARLVMRTCDGERRAISPVAVVHAYTHTLRDGEAERERHTVGVRVCVYTWVIRVALFSQ